MPFSDVIVSGIPSKSVSVFSGFVVVSFVVEVSEADGRVVGVLSFSPQAARLKSKKTERKIAIYFFIINLR